MRIPMKTHTSPKNVLNIRMVVKPNANNKLWDNANMFAPATFRSDEKTQYVFTVTTRERTDTNEQAALRIQWADTVTTSDWPISIAKNGSI